MFLIHVPLFAAAPTGIRLPDVEAPIMSLDEVKVGMRGYGRSVFAGTSIETFPVVVRSVVSDSSASRGTIWIECTGERMRHSGPVQGMSGSPIYLWDEGETGTDGEGGRLIGAFAFGYADVNVCLVGVQPIEYMREVGANAVATQDARRAADHAAAPRRVAPGTLARHLSQLTRAAEAADTTLVSPRATAALTALSRVMGQPGASTPQAWATDDDAARPLALPVSVGSAEAARWLAPALAPAGLAVRAGGAGPLAHARGVAGTPPSNVDLDEAQLQPGSVLSIPLAWGDVDLNAAGTVTEVRPDGTVLAFGHAMNAVGDTRLPIATGYTHFVVSRTSISFKRAGSLDIVGTLMRDEQAAVAGRPAAAGGADPAAFDAAPVSVSVQMPGQRSRDYNFMVVDDPTMTPGMVAAVVINAMRAVQDLPVEHTLRLNGTLAFSGGRTIAINEEMPNGGVGGVVLTLLPYIGSMMQNPFEPVRLENAQLSLVVEDQVKLKVITAASLDRAAAYPGETVSIAVQIEPFRAPAMTQTLELALPADLPAGEYDVMVTDVGGFVARRFLARPELGLVQNVDDLHRMLNALAEADSNAVYAALALPKAGLAVGQRALNDLPSSRAAVLSQAATTQVRPLQRFVEARMDSDEPVRGVVIVPLVVRDRP